jgi:excisionase family DNA binding protein
MHPDELLADLRRIDRLGPDEARGLLLSCAALLAALAAKASTKPAQGSPVCDEPQALLTMPAVARALGIPEGSARELGRRGLLPTVKIGRYVRVRKSDLEGWITSHRESPLDQSSYHGYSVYQGYKPPERMRIPSPSSRARSQSGQARRPHGNNWDQRGAVGKRGATYQRDGGQVPSAPGGDGGSSKD